ASASCKRSFNRGGFCASPIMLSKWTEHTPTPTNPSIGSWSTPIEISGHSSTLCVLGSTFSNKQANADACNFDQGSFPVVLKDGGVSVAFSTTHTHTSQNRRGGGPVSADQTRDGAGGRGGDEEGSEAALGNVAGGGGQWVIGREVVGAPVPR